MVATIKVIYIYIYIFSPWHVYVSMAPCVLRLRVQTKASRYGQE